MSFVEEIVTRVSGTGKRVLLPEAEDPRVVEAAAKIALQGIAEPLLFTDGEVPEGAVAIGPDFDPEPLVAAILKTRPQTKPAVARRMLGKPVMRAAAMVAAGD